MAPPAQAGDRFPPPDLGYWALFARFLRFGSLAFGGPVAQIAMIRRELVDEERWIDSARFNKLLAVMQVLPGPEAHELCVHLGIRARGRIGGLLAGLGFMLPGLLLMLGAAWLYTSLSIERGIAGAMFLGVQAAVLAVIARAVHRIGEHILSDSWLWAVAAGSAAATLAGASFWIVLAAAGAFHAFAAERRFAPAAAAVATAAVLAAATSSAGGTPSPGTSAGAATTLALFLAGLKGGLLTFGGAYTAIPFVRDDSVGRGWMSDAQFLDGVALAGVLPAPLVIFATFVGWVSGGPAGALAITAGIFLPAFAFSILFYERLEAIADHRRMQTLLGGIAAAVVGLIAVTLVDLGADAVERSPTLGVSAAIAALALVILYARRGRLATPVVLALGAAAGAVAWA